MVANKFVWKLRDVKKHLHYFGNYVMFKRSNQINITHTFTVPAYFEELTTASGYAITETFSK
jgi:hypothetical protein